jgi:DUF4097 and DUF4098 domain-containing protein YvlB
MRKSDWRQEKGLKLTVIIILSFLLVLPAIAGAKYEEKFEKTEKLAAEGLVMISNISGDIKVMVWQEDKVKIEALKKSEAGTQEKAKENAQKVEIQVNSEPGLVRIETRYPESNKFFGRGNSINVSVYYTLWIPARASIEAKSVSGDVEIDKAGGSIKASTISGDVDISGAKKSLAAKSVSGDVKIKEAEGDCDLSSVSGDVYASKVRGSVEAEVVSGSVKLLEVSEALRVTAKSVSGSVEYQGQILPNGTYKFSTHSGSIRLTLPASSSFDLEASAFSGGVSTEFPVEIVGRISAKEIKGRVNKGGAVVTAKAFSGDVEIRKGS